MPQVGIFETHDKDKGYICPCCGLFVKRYKRPFNCNMALLLIYLYKSGERGWVHVEKFLLERKLPRCGDFPKLCLWKFLEKKHEDRDDGSSRNGYYRLTGQALMFVEGKSTAREYAYIFNNKFEGFAGGEITIREALGKRFNYEELMSS